LCLKDDNLGDIVCKPPASKQVKRTTADLGEHPGGGQGEFRQIMNLLQGISQELVTVKSDIETLKSHNKASRVMQTGSGVDMQRASSCTYNSNVAYNNSSYMSYDQWYDRGNSTGPIKPQATRAGMGETMLASKSPYFGTPTNAYNYMSKRPENVIDNSPVVSSFSSPFLNTPVIGNPLSPDSDEFDSLSISSQPNSSQGQNDNILEMSPVFPLPSNNNNCTLVRSSSFRSQEANQDAISFGNDTPLKVKRYVNITRIRQLELNPVSANHYVKELLFLSLPRSQILPYSFYEHGGTAGIDAEVSEWLKRSAINKFPELKCNDKWQDVVTFVNKDISKKRNRYLTNIRKMVSAPIRSIEDAVRHGFKIDV
jgi:hypothetical protein